MLRDSIVNLNSKFDMFNANITEKIERIERNYDELSVKISSFGQICSRSNHSHHSHCALHCQAHCGHNWKCQFIRFKILNIHNFKLKLCKTSITVMNQGSPSISLRSTICKERWTEIKRMDFCISHQLLLDLILVVWYNKGGSTSFRSQSE